MFTQLPVSQILEVRECAQSSSAPSSSAQYSLASPWAKASTRQCANTLAVAARSSEGVIEAVESRDFSERWLVGVQWHPEGMRDTVPGCRNLFEAHVCAAERNASRRAAA